jgi:hypothetical protein
MMDNAFETGYSECYRISSEHFRFCIFDVVREKETSTISDIYD